MKAFMRIKIEEEGKKTNKQTIILYYLHILNENESNGKKWDGKPAWKSDNNSIWMVFCFEIQQSAVSHIMRLLWFVCACVRVFVHINFFSVVAVCFFVVFISKNKYHIQFQHNNYIIISNIWMVKRYWKTRKNAY